VRNQKGGIINSGWKKRHTEQRGRGKEAYRTLDVDDNAHNNHGDKTQHKGDPEWHVLVPPDQLKAIPVT